MEKLKSIMIESKNYEFRGSEDDYFFQNLEGFFFDNRGMGNWLSKNIATDATCLDIGANLGLTAITIAHYCPNGEVFAFEPSPVNASYLRENIERNKIK